MSSYTDLLKREEKRFEFIFDYIKNATYKDIIVGNLKLFINIDDDKYESSIDLDNSLLVIKFYQLNNTMAYLFQITLPNNNFYNSIVLTNKKISLKKEDIAFIDNRFKIDEKIPLFYIGIPLVTKDAISSVFADSSWMGSPFVVYTTTNISLFKNLEDTSRGISYVEYYDQIGNLICQINLNNFNDLQVISNDGNASMEYINDWLKKNINDIDDPTKLVEIAGYYHTSKRLAKLFKGIKGV